jgi:eukaryotic-like serine/threonine-protein kinase
LSLGEYGPDRLSQDQRLQLMPRLLQMYADNPHPGIHGAAEWLLRQWQASDELKAIDKELATGKVEGKRQWYMNRQGQTMMLVSRPDEFWMGGTQRGKHRRKIWRSFALASKNVTVEQFRSIMKRDPSVQFQKYAPKPEWPVINVSWYDAVEYCNQLSKLENIPEEEWCYIPKKDGKYEKGMQMAANYLQKIGYRLPTEAEWEYGCRAGAETAYSFGEADEVLGQYGWYGGNALGKTHPVGIKKPNDLGLFDMHGNVWQWCQDAWAPYPKVVGGEVLDDNETDIGIIT